MIKTLFLAPIRDNEGEPFQDSTWDELHERIVNQFGGLSRRAGVEGMWRNAGRLYVDPSYEYTVSLASWLQFPAWLEVILWVRDQFRQIAVYIEVAGIPETIGGSAPRVPNDAGL